MKLVLAALLLAIPFTASAAEQIIGVGMVLKQVEHKTFVEQLVPGAPAARDGRIHEGDEIVSVKSQYDSDSRWLPIEDLSMDEVVQMIRGEEHTNVGIHFASDKGQYEVMLTREPVDIP
jgi:carboxyl-terminal processing protease